jgi:hypothetical protein
MALIDHHVNQSYQDVLNALSDLRRTLQADEHLTPHALWSIPLRGQTQVDDTIPVERLYSQDALTLATTILTDPYLQDGQHPHESWRAPGIIGVSPATLKVVNEVNRYKEALTAAMAGYTEAERTRLHRQQKGVSAKQALRRLEIVDQPEKLRFQWYGGVSVNRFTVQSLRHQLLYELREAAGNPDISLSNLPSAHPEAAIYPYIKQLQDLNGLPDREVIAEKRLTQPHVRCYVRAAGTRYYAQVAMPMLFNIHQGAPEIDGDLVDFDRNLKGSKPKASRFEETPLVMHKPIFRYLPDFRTLQDAVIHQDLRYQRKKSR